MAALTTAGCGSLDISGNGGAPPRPQATETLVTGEPAVQQTPLSAAVNQSPQFDLSVFAELNPRPQIRPLDRSIDLGFDEREAAPRDWINPVYSPKFATADEIASVMTGDELVMGVEINGDARAYPVGIMRVREMVNDVVGGVPLLVTW